MHASLNTPPVQAPQALGALRLPPEPGTPHSTPMRFTVKLEDYRDAMKIFNDLAQSKVIRTRLESDTFEMSDYGGGVGLYNTLAFQLQPNPKENGHESESLNSPALRLRFADFQREFQEKLSEAGIRNYAPEA
ncbi:hypothetical protein [Pseudomonas sp. MPB26]|uniref:hypothetical protein n=1 Tax=Pseudomonas sp. MPB26 TaxID=3388491 RepID=UPI0039850852